MRHMPIQVPINSAVLQCYDTCEISKYWIYIHIAARTCRTSNITHTPARASRLGKTPDTASQSGSVTASNVQAKVIYTHVLHELHILMVRMLGGWDPMARLIPADIDAQIDQAFQNVELALKTAGGKGWSQVFRVNSYHIPMDNEALGAMVRNFKRWMPDHEPIWTCVGVVKLGEDAMKVEIEVSAHDPQ